MRFFRLLPLLEGERGRSHAPVPIPVDTDTAIERC